MVLFLIGLSPSKGLMQNKGVSSTYNPIHFSLYSQRGTPGSHNPPPLGLHVPVQLLASPCSLRALLAHPHGDLPTCIRPRQGPIVELVESRL